MATPTKTDVVTLDWAFDGVPFVQITSSAPHDTRTLDSGFDGVPFVAVDNDPVPPPTGAAVVVILVNIG